MAIASPFSFYLITEKLPTSFTGRVNGTLSSPYMTIPFDGGTVGSISPIPGMSVWFGSTAGASDRGILRLRTFAGSTTGQISVAESDDVGPVIQDNDFITIKQQFRLWPIYPFQVLLGGLVFIYEDYDTLFNSQTINWKPVANAGPPAVVEYNGATAQCRFVGDRSFALAPGATLTGYLWTAPGSVEGTSTSQGTEASPVTFTWTSTGQKLVYLRVTDSNGVTATNYTWVWVVDPNNPETVAFVDYDNHGDNFDREQGGGQCSFTVHGQGDTTNFPDETLVVVASRPNVQQTTPTATWPFRDNVHFVGYILGDTVRYNARESDVNFTAASIDTLMKNITAYPVTLTTRNTATDWVEAEDLTPDRAASYLWHYRSTLSTMAPISRSGYSALIQRQDFGPTGGQYGQLDSELLQTMWGKVTVNHQGVIHHEIDYNLMLSSERSSITVRKTLHKGIWVEDIDIEEKNAYSLPVNVVKMSGVYYPGGELEDICPLFSEAPGNAPKVFGSEKSYDRLILTSQDDLNTRCGLALAKLNAKYPQFGMRFINDGSFTIAPQELFPSNIEADDNDRGLALTTRLIPRRISRQYDHDRGIIFYDVSFEPETSGPAGVTVDLPCGPPEQKKVQSPLVPPQAHVPFSLAGATNGESFYFAETIANSWDRRVVGLTDLHFSDMIKDPWSDFKQGASIDNIILWGSGPGFLTRTKDTGRHWSDHTVYLDSPPNSWSDGAAPTITGTTYKQVLGNMFQEDHLYVLAQAQAGALYRGWLMRSTDGGFTFSSYALTGTSQALPIRMDVDKQDGTILWVTLWEGDGSINLRKYGISGAGLSLSSTITLQTGTTSSHITSKTYIAYPFAPFGNKNLIYIYGRLDGPASLVGTNQIIKSTNQGSSWSAIVNDWVTDHCGALYVSPQYENGTRGVWAVRQAV